MASASHYEMCVTLQCLQGAFGPFKPNVPVEVPIWLAVALQKRNNCRILQPDWLNPETLQGTCAALLF